MSDDAISTRKPRKQTRRVLVVSNASPPGSSDDDSPRPEPQKPLVHPNKFPRPLPSPSVSLHDQYSHERYYQSPNNSHIPPRLTNLTTSGYPRSTTSNPPLSSPSSTSSPAVESTPPPSTPGLSTSSIQLTDEGTIRPDMIMPVASDRNDNTPPATRPRPFVRSHVAHDGRRMSHSGPRPNTSPTVSTPDSYVPSAPHMFRPNQMEKVLLLVTLDTENFHMVDITGAMTPAFIRERIFTKLQVPDEDQSKYSIYRTEIGRYAISEALTDEELFELYKERGDSGGSLKLLVSHSSASVREPTFDHIPPSSVNTIPPPVLPQDTLYAPLRPNRQTRIRQGSQSSASEHHPAEVGYDASVSDDLDHGDTDGGGIREYPRAAIHSRALPVPRRPPSPSGYHRSRSPGNLLSPERTMAHSPETHTYRPDPYHHIGASPMPGTSPKTSRFDPSQPLPPLPHEAHSPAPEAAIGRERTFTNESQSNYSDRARTTREREERRRRERKEGSRYPREQESGGSRQKNDPWTIVPSDVPPSEYKKERPTTPQEGRSNGRFALSPPSALNPLSYRPSPGGSETSSRKKPLKVPGHWAVTWKHSPGLSSKSDPKASPAPSPSLLRHGGAKSMTDMRGAYKHPASLQPGRGSRAPPQPPLPLNTRPPTAGSVTGGPSLPSASSSGDVLSAHSDIGMSPDIRGALSPPGYIRPVPTPYGSSIMPNGYLGSPAQDPVPRPLSAASESSGTPFSHPRALHSPQNSETYDPISQRLPILGYGTNVSSQSYRDEPLRTLPSHTFSDQQSEVPSGSSERPLRPTRTPPRSPGGNLGSSSYVPNGSESTMMTRDTLPGAAFAQRGAIDEDGGSHTIRGDDRTWLEGFIDETAPEGTARPRPKAQAAGLPQRATPPPVSENSAFSTATASTLVQTQDEYEDSDSDGDGRGSLWIVAPKNLGQPKTNGRPPLAPLVFPSEANSASPPANADYGRSPPPNFPGPPDFMPPAMPPRTPRRTGAITQPTKKLKDRISKFDNNFDVTWAPRPPPEVMYERLEEYFPEHDLDKPVIDAPSGGTSPTATEAPAAPTPQRFKHKKSIRYVAEEHKRQMDRRSRGEDSTVAPMSRKRHTKLWGSKLEEVTTEQGKGPLSSTSDSSPGGAKPAAIFRWVRGELIGKGTYGRVYLALNATTGEMIAVKQVEIPRTASDKEDTRQNSVVEALKSESETLKDLDHPHIVQYLGFEETPTFLSIFLEYVPGGSIASCLRKHGRFDEEVTKSFTGQILSGLEYLHSRGILHRDLKADNILVETSGVCKISDFGISKRTDDVNMAAAYTSMQGTVFWMAPEVVNSKGKGYNSKIDIWSVGCVVFEMWTGQRPWSGQEAMAVLLHLYQTKQAPPVPDGILLSALADDFRLKCFAADPDERPSATELRKHPYLELQPGWSFNGFK